MKEYLKMGDYFVGDMIPEDVVILDGGVATIIYSSEEAACHAINSHDELVETNKELLAELKAMSKAYVKLLEAGKDRIESLGGDCDPVSYMAAHDVYLVHACGVIGKYDMGAA